MGQKCFGKTVETRCQDLVRLIIFTDNQGLQMRIGFWNIKKKAFMDDIVSFTLGKDLDIIILAECPLSTRHIEGKLSAIYNGVSFHSVPQTHPKIKIFSRFSPGIVTNHDALFGGPSWTINSFEIPNTVKFSLVCVHLPSKLFWDDVSQSFEAVNLMNGIRKFEKVHGKNSIVIGDFNMNPYEPGMTSALGLHGLNDANIAKSGGRLVQNTFYDFFYNPMWNFLGDRDPVPGTHYYRQAVHRNVMWNTFDQVLIRPSLLQDFKLADVEIVTKIGPTELTDPKSKKLKKQFSDHLPVFISLNL